jgi:tetratricopeptide (TPR) repeat protein
MPSVFSIANAVKIFVKDSEHFPQSCSAGLKVLPYSGLLGCWLRFGSVTGFFKPAPSPKPRQKPKILAAHRYIFSVNALIINCVRLSRWAVALAVVAGFACAGYAQEIPDLITNAVGEYKAGNYDQAIDDFSKLIQLNVHEAYIGRARAYYKKHDYDRAIADLDEVIKQAPTVSTLTLRAEAYSQKENYQKAVTDYSLAIQLQPKNPELYVSRADALFYGGAAMRAFANYDRAIQLKTTNAFAYAHRGELYAAIRGDYARGIADCTKSIQLNPHCWLGYNNLAALLTICPNAKIRDGRRALLNARAACELTDWKNPLTLSVLAGAYAEIHDFADAVNWQEQSMDMEMDTGTLEPSAQTKLDLYEHHRPFHAAKK